MEIIEDVSDLFFTEANSEETSKKKFLTEHYTPRQIGSIVKYVEPVNSNSPLSHVVDVFAEDKELNAVPVEEHDRVIGMIDRATVENATDSTLKRITTKNAGNYITVRTDMIMLDASDFIERDLQKITDINKKYRITDFPVFDNKNFSRSFLGIANLNDILNRLAEIREQDLQKAAIIQEGLFPKADYIGKLPYKLTGWNRMANSLGGDIYQALRINDDESFVGIFDVSGKNVAASLITMSIASFFKITDNNSFFSNKPSAFVSMLDKYIASIAPEGTFVTSVICYFNTKQNVVYIYNCGHTVAYLLFNTDGNSVKLAGIDPLLSPMGIGMVSETLSQKYEKVDRPFTVTKYQPNMHINLFSDGLTDMYNKDFEVFDEERAKNFFTSLYAEQDEKVADRIRQLVDNFTAETLIPDDITVLDIRL